MVIFVEDEKDLQETDELKSPDRILEEGLDKFNDLVDIIKDALNKGEVVCIHGNKPSISDVNTEEKVIEAVNKLGEIDMVALMNTIRETADMPLFSLIGTLENQIVHYTCKDRRKIEHIVPVKDVETIVNYLTPEEKEACGKAYVDSFISAIIEDDFAVRANRYLKGYYVNNITKLKNKQWKVTIGCLVDEDGNEYNE